MYRNEQTFWEVLKASTMLDDTGYDQAIAHVMNSYQGLVRKVILSSLFALKLNAPRAEQAFQLATTDLESRKKNLTYRGHEIYFCSSWQQLEDTHREEQTFMEMVFAPRNKDPFDSFGFSQSLDYVELRGALLQINNLLKYANRAGIWAGVSALDTLIANGYILVQNYRDPDKGKAPAVNLILRHANRRFTTVAVTLHFDVIFEDDNVIQRQLSKTLVESM